MKDTEYFYLHDGISMFKPLTEHEAVKHMNKGMFFVRVCGETCGVNVFVVRHFDPEEVKLFMRGVVASHKYRQGDDA